MYHIVTRVSGRLQAAKSGTGVNRDGGRFPAVHQSTRGVDRHRGRLEAEVNQCRLEQNEVIASIAKENVDVLRESREAVIRDCAVPDDHVVNAMDVEQP